MLLILVEIMIGWILYGIVHSVLATSRIKMYALHKLGVKENLYLFLYNIIALITIVPLIYFSFIIPRGLIFNTVLFTTISGWVFCIIGLLLMINAAKNYFLFLSGISATAKKELQTTGLHKHMRHPIYTGTFMFLIGILLLQPYYTILVSVVTIIIYTVIGTYWEEQKLLKVFGYAYIDYSKQTPKFIPFTIQKEKKI